MKTKNLEFSGVVLNILPNANYTVKITVEKRDFYVLAYLCGKMTKNFINPEVGDKVLIEVSPIDFKNADKMKGRIIRRFK